MPSSTVTSQGQTTLPREVREALGVGPGDRIVYDIEDGSVRVRSARAAIDALYGVFARPDTPPQELRELRERFEEDVARRVMKQ